MKFAFYTLGCKVNQYETQAMEQLLCQRGHSIGTFSEACDGYVINTCSVTAVADRKNRTLIRRCRREHPQAVLAVCGCYSQHDAKTVWELGADLVGGSSDRADFVEALVAAAQDRKHRQVLDQALQRRAFQALPAGGLEERTRAMLKVQDGCVNFCSYCIIPYTRGPVRSAPVELVVAQARELAQRGYREVVVTGIEIASWGVDLPGKPTLALLLEQVCQAVPHLRVRLGSLEPRIVTEEFCRRLRRLDNLCPHFHLSMQSGCDSVLTRMKRKYSTERYLESVELLKAWFPGCAITTDMIVAFPGETQQEHESSLEFIRLCGFADMHIFPYSRRPGTPADKMPGQLPNVIKEARSREAIAVARDMKQAWEQAQLGQCQPVLFEENQGGYALGHTPNYARIYVKTDQDLHNRILEVRLLSRHGDGLLGEIVCKGPENLL